MDPQWYTYATDEHKRNTCVLGGPYVDLDAAKADLRRIREECSKIDGFSHWWTYTSILLSAPPTRVAFPSPIPAVA